MCAVFIPVPYCFNHCTFIVYLKSGNVMPSALFFALTIHDQGLLWFYTNFNVCTVRLPE